MMIDLSSFACLGVDYRTAPVAVRERFAVPAGQLEKMDLALRSLPGMDGVVLLSTCNRTEIYFESGDPAAAARSIFAFFETSDSSHFRLLSGADALRHLALVAAGLDSMVIGETEIFGQLKQAYSVASAAHSADSLIHRLFQASFNISKKVRSSLPITVGPTSVGAAAVQLAQDIIGDLSGSSVLVVGAGDVARSTAQSLSSRGARSIFVANRSYERALDLASRVGGQVIRFADWIPFLARIDIVIVSTAAPVYVVGPDVLRQACSSRQGRPLFLIDLSVPRNVDPQCAELDGVTLYDMDAMQEIAQQTLRHRTAAVRQGEAIVDAWLREFSSDSVRTTVHPEEAEFLS